MIVTEKLFQVSRKNGKSTQLAQLSGYVKTLGGAMVNRSLQTTFCSHGKPHLNLRLHLNTVLYCIQ